jgi:LuxR family maltose regulon positive regulatory protein
MRRQTLRGGRRAWGASDMRQRASRTRRAGRPAVDLVASKLQRPRTRPETVHRSSLVERLARDDSRPIASVVAPAGYGKTTLLSQWAEHNGQTFGWVSVDEADNEPKVMLCCVAEALDAVEPVGARVFDALASSMSSEPASSRQRVLDLVLSRSRPFHTRRMM